MSKPAAIEDSKPSGWVSGNVWASPATFGSNPVKQLVVPSSEFRTVVGENGALEVRNNYGAWPAAPPDRPLADDRLWAKLPLGAKAGDQLKSASWHVPRLLSRSSPAEVLGTYQDVLTFNEGTKVVAGLRSPQLGAVHAVLDDRFQGMWDSGQTRGRP